MGRGRVAEGQEGGNRRGERGLGAMPGRVGAAVRAALRARPAAGTAFLSAGKPGGAQCVLELSLAKRKN